MKILIGTVLILILVIMIVILFLFSRMVSDMRKNNPTIQAMKFKREIEKILKQTDNL